MSRNNFPVNLHQVLQTLLKVPLSIPNIPRCVMACVLPSAFAPMVTFGTEITRYCSGGYPDPLLPQLVFHSACGGGDSSFVGLVHDGPKLPGDGLVQALFLLATSNSFVACLKNTCVRKLDGHIASPFAKAGKCLHLISWT